MGGIKQSNGSYVSSHLAILNTDKSVELFTPVKNGDTLTVMDSADGPSTGYAKCLSDSFDVAKKNGKISKPKAALLFYCGGMSIAVGDNLGKGLSGPKFQSKLVNVPMMGCTVFGEQACTPVGNVQR